MYAQLEDAGEENANGDNESDTELTAAELFNYGSTSELQRQRDAASAAPSIPRSSRLVLFIMTYIGLFYTFSYRVAFNEAIVAMVNNTGTDPSANLSTSSFDTDGRCPRNEEELRRHTRARTGEFDWSRVQQTTAIAAFFYGFGPLQMTWGWLADHFGAKWPLGVSILVVSVTALLSPVLATANYALLVISRVVAGLLEGAKNPCVGALVAAWTTPNEKSTILSTVMSTLFTASDSGGVVGFLLAGVLCDYGFAGGWPSVFYVFGMLGFLWCMLWFMLGYSSPATHPRISQAERAYLEAKIGVSSKDDAHRSKTPATPWRRIFTSLPVWSLTAVMFCYHLNLEMLTMIPIYLHDVVGVSMTVNGLIGSLPFLVVCVTSPLGGVVADRLISSGTLPVTTVRKLSCVISLVPCVLFLVLVAFLGCRLEMVVLGFVFSNVFFGFANITVYTNQLDLSSSHAGMLVGITGFFGVIGGMISPNIVGALTSDLSDVYEWRNVFYVHLAINVVAAVFYLACGSGERQPWGGDVIFSELQT